MMEELSLNILDLAQNSIKAEATVIKVELKLEKETLTIRIEDNGRGMSGELLEKAADPFVTTRTTRKLGLGIPFFKEAAELTGGYFKLCSKEGEGTQITGVFGRNHIDRPPVGDLAQTLTTLILLNPNLKFILNYETELGCFHFSTDQVRERLGQAAELNHPEVIAFLSAYLSEQIKAFNGGALE